MFLSEEPSPSAPEGEGWGNKKKERKPGTRRLGTVNFGKRRRTCDEMETIKSTRRIQVKILGNLKEKTRQGSQGEKGEAVEKADGEGGRVIGAERTRQSFFGPKKRTIRQTAVK